MGAPASRLAALLAAAALTACSSAPAAPPIRSHVALFRVDTSALAQRDVAKESSVARAVLDECADGRLSARLQVALDAACGAGSTTLLARSFAQNLDYAWDQDPEPDLAIVAKLKPADVTPDGKAVGAIAGTVGWLLIGIPGYIIDDYEDRPPFELELRIYEGVERSERDLGEFQVGGEAISTNFIQRNGASVLPYVMTLVVPPHLISRWDQDDPEASADLLLQSVVDAAARDLSTRIRAWELESAGGREGG